MEDAAVAQFTSITGTSTERASQYLRLTDGNLEQAMQLFFDSDGIDMEGSAPPSSSAPVASSQPPTAPSQQHHQSSRAGGHTDDGGIIHINSDDEISDDNDPEITGYNARAGATSRSRSALHTPAAATPPAGVVDEKVNDDEALARRLQEELYAGGDMAGGRDADGIRAPIGRTTETLVGPGADYLSDPDEMRAAVLEQMQARQRPRPQGTHSMIKAASGLGL